MSCDKHLTHPEHWPGDAGAVAESLAPFAVAAVASEVVLRQIAEMLHIDYDALPTRDFLGGIHPAAKVIAQLGTALLVDDLTADPDDD